MKFKSLIALLLSAMMLLGLFACSQGQDKPTSSSGGEIISSGEPLEEYSITYDLDGGTAENPATYTKEDEFTLNNPSKEGYSFVGWTYGDHQEPELSVRIVKGSEGDLSFTAHWELYDFEPLKIAVFADIQLTTGDRQSGSVANAVIALKDHFTYAKSIGADVLLMSGDIINNAIEGYYELYESVLKDVYGEDESTYPEFVMNMGNHEWWDRKEKNTAEAVSMFKRYARIESPNLVKQSRTPYYLDANETLPSYYKVIKGVPFLVVSADNSSGEIGVALKEELTAWLEEIAQLESVKKGGPIFVSYHYPIPDVTYNGEHSSITCAGIDELLKDYPSAIVFTGDTHFNSVNERTINQIDYTSINIGSSSYSRCNAKSATGFTYDNVTPGSGKTGANQIKGDVAFKYEYTPTIMVVEMNNPEKTLINRYYTASDPAAAKKVGITWEIPQIKSKEAFTYTDGRIQNPAWANVLYGKDGLSWGAGQAVRYNVEGGKMIVSFPDVTDFNCAEHYRIEVKDGANDQNVKYYDYVGHYYKYEDEAHQYNFVLENLPAAESYTVTVTAYDFFDNPSLNVLTAGAKDETLAFADEIDVRSLDAYSDISRRVSYTETAEGSTSSVEFYFKGTKRFSAGMAAQRVILESGGKDTAIKQYLSVTDWTEAVLTFKVKNPNDFDLYIGLTLVTKVNGQEQWLSDGGREYRVTVPANSDWTTIKWNFAKQFGITSDIISNLGIKVIVPDEIVDVNNGYELSFFIDDVDVVSEVISLPHEYKMQNTSGEDFYGNNLFSGTLEDILSFEYKLVTPSENPEQSTFGFMVYDGSVWANYVNYISFNPYTNASEQDYVIITPIGDGWYSVKIDLSMAEVVGDRATLAAANLSYIYAPSVRANCVIYLDNFKAEARPKHQAAYGNRKGEATKINVFSATTSSTIKFYYKIDEFAENAADSRFAFMIFDGDDWQNWLGYVTINAYTNRSTTAGVTITEDEDGWFEVTIDVDALPVGQGEKTVLSQRTLSAIYFRPAYQTCSVYVTEFTVE